MRVIATELPEVLLIEPDVFLMLLRRPATTPASLRARERVYAALAEAGVPEDLVPRVERLVSTFMLGFAASEAGGRFAQHSRDVLDADLEWALGLVRGVLGGGGRSAG